MYQYRMPALEYVKLREKRTAGEGEKRKGYSQELIKALCVGCGVCQELCKFGCIQEAS